MEYDIVATLGPASKDEAVWTDIISAGANRFRLNTSHLTPDGLIDWLNRLERYFTERSITLPVILDLQGSKWRLGEFNFFELIDGSFTNLILGTASNKNNTLPVPHPDFFRASQTAPGTIILNDGKIELQKISASEESVKAVVMRGGVISSRKGITLSSSEFRNESLSIRDNAIITGIAEKNYNPLHLSIYYAVSYIKDAAEMKSYRNLFPPEQYLIAKLEREIAITDAIAIAEQADELWVCRGDLGAEAGLTGMAKHVHNLTQHLAEIKAPVFMAGQVLEHMTQNELPTRSEICYIHDSILHGYKGFILSDETAAGLFPSESCRILSSFRS